MPGELSKPGRDALSRLLFLAGSTLLVFYAVLLVLQAGVLLAGARLEDAGTLLAAVSALGYFWLVGRRLYRLPLAVLAVGLAGLAALIVLCGWVAANYFDLSWDGRDYQQKAIRQLAGGWNPVYEQVQPLDAYDNAWLNHYPKGAWIAAASVVKLSGNIENGKLFNLLLMVAVFLISLSYFLSYTRLRSWQALLLALFLAANPVSVYQSLSYYVDGQVSSALILLGLCMLLCLKSADIGHLAALGSAIVIGLNIKFTGTAYTLLLLAVFTLTVILVGQYAKLPFRVNTSQHGLFARLTGNKSIWFTILSAALLGLLVIGWQPYATNTLHFGNPFYPIYGSSLDGGQAFDKEFVLQGQIPPDFESMDWLEKLLRSIFSPSDNRLGVESGPLKIPLSVTRPEVMAFTRPDVRISGWGPLFGASLVISLVTLVALVFISRKHAAIAAAMMALVVGTTLLNSEAWWARYTPQLWLLPVIALGSLWLARGGRAHWMGYLLAALMFANLSLIAGAYLGWNTVSTRELRATLVELRQSGEEVMLYYGPLEAAGMRLQDYGIPYRWVERRDELPCPRQLELRVFYSPLECPPTP